MTTALILFHIILAATAAALSFCSPRRAPLTERLKEMRVVLSHRGINLALSFVELALIAGNTSYANVYLCIRTRCPYFITFGVVHISWLGQFGYVTTTAVDEFVQFMF